MSPMFCYEVNLNGEVHATFWNVLAAWTFAVRLDSAAIVVVAKSDQRRGSQIL